MSDCGCHHEAKNAQERRILTIALVLNAAMAVIGGVAGWIGQSTGLLADALDTATGQLLDNNKRPSPKTGQLDNRCSHFYLALYWAQALAAQDENAELKAKFAPLAKALADNEATIIGELNGAQGKAIDIGGYYHPDLARTAAAMRPSRAFNEALATLSA